MSVFDRVPSGGCADPFTLQCAILFAVVSACLAGFFGPTLRLAVQRVLAHDQHARIELMACSAMPLTREAWWADTLPATAFACGGLEPGAGLLALEGIGLPHPQTTAVRTKDRHSAWMQEQNPLPPGTPTTERTDP